jgi:hypothetical protein
MIQNKTHDQYFYDFVDIAFPVVRWRRHVPWHIITILPGRIMEHLTHCALLYSITTLPEHRPVKAMPQSLSTAGNKVIKKSKTHLSILLNGKLVNYTRFISLLWKLPITYFCLHFKKEIWFIQQKPTRQSSLSLFNRCDASNSWTFYKWGYTVILWSGMDAIHNNGHNSEIYRMGK